MTDTTTAAAPIATDAASRAAVAAERTRARAIRDTARRLRLPTALADEMIDGGTPLADATARMQAEWVARGDTHEYGARPAVQVVREHNAPHEVRARMIDGLASRIDGKREPRAGASSRR